MVTWANRLGEIMKFFDRALSALMLLGAAGHLLGSTRFYLGQRDAQYWAQWFTLVIVLVGAINLLRSFRPDDKALAWLAAGAALSYAASALTFGLLIGNMVDPRVVGFTAIALGLALISLRTALRRP